MVCRGAIRTSDLRVAQLSRTSSPTCRRLAPDFALFPFGYQDSVHLAGVPYPKSAKSAAADYRPSRRHVGGTGSKDLPDIRGGGRVRTIVRKTTVFIGTNSFDRTEKAPPRIAA